MKSSMVLGEYLGAGLEGFTGRYFSSLGSNHLTNLRITLSNML